MVELASGFGTPEHEEEMLDEFIIEIEPELSRLVEGKRWPTRAEAQAWLAARLDLFASRSVAYAVRAVKRTRP